MRPNEHRRTITRSVDWNASRDASTFHDSGEWFPLTGYSKTKNNNQGVHMKLISSLALLFSVLSILLPQLLIRNAEREQQFCQW